MQHPQHGTFASPHGPDGSSSHASTYSPYPREFHPVAPYGTDRYQPPPALVPEPRFTGVRTGYEFMDYDLVKPQGKKRVPPPAQGPLYDAYGQPYAAPVRFFKGRKGTIREYDGGRFWEAVRRNVGDKAEDSDEEEEEHRRAPSPPAEAPKPFKPSKRPQPPHTSRNPILNPGPEEKTPQPKDPRMWQNLESHLEPGGDSPLPSAPVLREISPPLKPPPLVEYVGFGKNTLIEKLGKEPQPPKNTALQVLKASKMHPPLKRPAQTPHRDDYSYASQAPYWTEGCAQATSAGDAGPISALKGGKKQSHRAHPPVIVNRTRAPNILGMDPY